MDFVCLCLILWCCFHSRRLLFAAVIELCGVFRRPLSRYSLWCCVASFLVIHLACNQRESKYEWYITFNWIRVHRERESESADESEREPNESEAVFVCQPWSGLDRAFVDHFLDGQCSVIYLTPVFGGAKFAKCVIMVTWNVQATPPGCN